MLCSDFFSDVCFLSYKSLDWIWCHGPSLHNVAVWIRDLCNVLRLEKLFHNWDWYSLIWFAWIHMLLLVWSVYILSIADMTMFALHYELSTMHDPWLSHCTSPWLCMNCWKSSKHLYIGACWCPQEAVICPFTTWLERPTLRDERYVKKLSNLLCLTRCGYYDHLEEDGQLYPNMTT